MTKMKKILAVGLASVLAVSFAACSNGGAKGDTAMTGLAVIDVNIRIAGVETE